MKNCMNHVAHVAILEGFAYAYGFEHDGCTVRYAKVHGNNKDGHCHMSTTRANALTHIREVNYAAMTALLQIAAQDVGAAAMLFATKAEVVERLLEHERKDAAAGRLREGYIASLTDAAAPVFEVVVGQDYLDDVTRAPQLNDMCQPGQPYERFAPIVKDLNRTLVLSLRLLAHDTVESILALNLPVPVIEALAGMNTHQVLKATEHVGRPLVRLRPTLQVLDMFFCRTGGTHVEPEVATWTLMCCTDRAEVDELGRMVVPPEVLVEETSRAGRKVEDPFTKLDSDLMEMVGCLGGNLRSAIQLLGPQMNKVGLKRILAHASPSSEQKPGGSWSWSGLSLLTSSGIALMAMRLQRAGFPFGEAHLRAYYYYRFHMASAAPFFIRLNDYINRIVTPIQRREAWLEYTAEYDAAYVILNANSDCQVCSPHEKLVMSGRLGASRRLERHRKKLRGHMAAAPAG